MDLLNIFTRTVAGEWNNKAQSRHRPFDFAHVVLTFQVLESGQIMQTQRYKYESNPYRQRILTLSQVSDTGLSVDVDAEQGQTKSQVLMTYDPASQGFKSATKGVITGEWKGTPYVLSSTSVITEKYIKICEGGKHPDTGKMVWGQTEEGGGYLFLRVK
jgi:hypothetical protein